MGLSVSVEVIDPSAAVTAGPTARASSVAPFDGLPVPSGSVANLSGVGLLAVAVSTTPCAYPMYAGVGALAALVAGRSFVMAAFAGSGSLSADASMPARGSGSGALAATAWPGSVQSVALTGSGTAAAAVQTALPATLTGSGALAATASPLLTAGLSGSGALAAVSAPLAAAAFSGSGALSAQQGTYSVTAGLTGSGALSATVARGWFAQQMYKSGSTWSSLSNSGYTQITGWTADTTNDPGSVISGDALQIQVGKTNATLAASIVFTNSSFSANVTLQIRVNGTVAVTGTATASGTSGTTTITASGTYTVNAGDLVTLWATSNASSFNPTVAANTASTVKAS
ncbi:hypothetical protein ACFXG4_27065 [Nocardia sp. NPDC059246]|uniref:hypothetical protein n=1 Tax=unclassified Nocardia TaxID=2637762 RepID=UPI0036CDF871